VASEVQEAKFRLADAKRRVKELQIRGKANAALIRQALSQFTQDIGEYDIEAAGLHLKDLEVIREELLTASREIKDLERFLGQD